MPVSEKAAKLHNNSIVIDMSIQYLTKRTNRSDKSGLTAVGLTIPIPGEDIYQTFYRVRDFLEIIDKEPLFCLAETPDSIRQAHVEGKMAHIFLSQDSLFIGADPKNLLVWKQMGLRVSQLTYNEKNLVGDGCLELNDGGLSRFGQVLIREMERVGITIDLTHAGERTFMEACARAKKPLITTHSNPKALVNNPRNIKDDQMKAVAETGGVVCVTTWAPLIWNGKPGMPVLDDFIHCLEYAIELLGIDHVATSTDSMGTLGAYPVHEHNPDTLDYGSVTDEFDRLAKPEDSNNRQPADFNGIQDYPMITEKLLGRGYAIEDVKKILGENLMRVFDETWNTGFFK